MGAELIYILIGLTVLVGMNLAWLQTPRGKGWIGEFWVKHVIGKTKEGEKYVINDLRLKVDDSKTSQIDHVLINKKGVFVIETKNYSGRIYGKENQHEWTQVLKYGRVKNRFYNPVKQNKTHTYHISNVISEKVPLKSAVVFTQNNLTYVESTGVYSLSGLKNLIHSGKSVLSADQMERVFNEIKNCNDRSITLSEHVSNIKNMMDDVENGVCPRCGKELLLRNGKNGEFLGCSGYPKCKFTKKK